MMAENPRSQAEKLGQAIQIRRAELQMKRPRLAQLAELSYPYVSEIENGTKTPSTKALAQISQALELSASELMQRAENLPGSTTDDDSVGAMFLESAAPLFDTGPQQQVLGGRSSRPIVSATGGGDRRSPQPTQSEDRRLEDLITTIVRAEIRAELAAWVRLELPALIESEVVRLLSDRGILD